MTSIYFTKIDVLATRFRSGDYVKAVDFEGEIFVAKVDSTHDGICKSIDAVGNEHSSYMTETYKATKKEYEIFTEELMEIAGEEGSEIIADTELDSEEEIGVRIHPDHTRYTRHSEVTASGRSCYDISDYVADILRGLNLEDVYHDVATYMNQMGVEELSSEQVLYAKYEHLNPGMQRMNLGNLLRGTMRRLGVDKLDINATYES